MEFASARISPTQYYAFYSRDQQKYYYKDSKTGDILWEYPYKGFVLDDNTCMKFDPKQTHSKVPIPSNFKYGVFHPFNSLFTLPPMESILQGKMKSGTLEIKNNRGSSRYDFGFLILSPEDMLIYDDTMKAIPLSRKLPRLLRKKARMHSILFWYMERARSMLIQSI